MAHQDDFYSALGLGTSNFRLGMSWKPDDFRRSLESKTQVLCGQDTDNKAQCITRTTELNAVFISGRLRTTRGAEFIQTLESTWRCESNIWSPFHIVGHIAMTHQQMTPRCMKGQEQRYTSTGAEHSCSLQFKGGQHNLLCMLLVFWCCTLYPCWS